MGNIYGNPPYINHHTSLTNNHNDTSQTVIQNETQEQSAGGPHDGYTGERKIQSSLNQNSDLPSQYMQIIEA